jgi:hypothetical protein
MRHFNEPTLKGGFDLTHNYQKNFRVKHSSLFCGSVSDANQNIIVLTPNVFLCVLSLKVVIKVNCVKFVEKQEKFENNLPIPPFFVISFCPYCFISDT